MVEAVLEKEIQVVVFRLGEEEFGVPITQVREINRVTSPTKIPQSPPFVEGVINLRGQIIPIIDLKKRFDLPNSEYTNEARIVVLEICGHTVGILVDAVAEVLRLALSSIDNAPGIVSGVETDFITGVGKIDQRLLIMLNLNLLLSEQERQALADLSESAE